MMVLEDAIALIHNFVRTQFLLNVRQVGYVQICMAAAWIVSAIYRTVGHVRILRIVHRLFCIHISRQSFLLLLLLAVIEALDHIAVLIVYQVAILRVAMHELSASITLLVVFHSLSSLLIILQVESIVSVFLVARILTSFLFVISEVLTILIVQAFI